MIFIGVHSITMKRVPIFRAARASETKVLRWRKMMRKGAMVGKATPAELGLERVTNTGVQELNWMF